MASAPIISLDAIPYVIKTIDLESYKKDNGFYEVNLCPGREFDSEVHVLLYKEESWGNYHYFQYFRAMDEQNIKVIVYCIFTLFPLASIIGHEVRMHKVNGSSWFTRRSSYGFDRAKAWYAYDIPNSKNKNWDVSNVLKTECAQARAWEINTLAGDAYQRPMYIDATAYKLFSQNEFPSKCVMVLAKMPRFRRLMEKIDDLNLEYVSGTNGQIQRKLANEFSGSDYLLTYQILMSIFNQVEFFGVGGISSLFVAVPTISTLYVSDNKLEDNVDDKSIIFKTLLNWKIFNRETIGITHIKHNNIDFSSLERFQENSWMWNSIQHILKTWEPSEREPNVEFEHGSL